MRLPLLVALAVALASHAPAAAQPPRQVRAIALGPRLDLRTVATEEAFRAEVERLMIRARRDFAADRPNLVVVGGSWDRLTAYLGPEHQAARAARTRDEARAALLAAHAWPLLGAKATRWGLSDERALYLVQTDTLYRPFVKAFSEAARRHAAYVLACTVVPDVEGLKPFQSMRTFRDRPVRPLGTGVYRKAFLFDPDGRLVGEAKQVYLGAEDGGLTPGKLEEVHPFDLPFGRVGVALGEDARRPEYLRTLDEQGCQILLAPAVEVGAWAEEAPDGAWQPSAWLDAALGPLQAARSRSVRYTVAPMPSGLYFETCFDGQSAIMARGDETPQRLYVGVDPEVARSERAYTGQVLALSPWVVEDPRFVHGSAGPATSLSDRREYLRKVARTLLRGGKREDQFVESCATADLEVR